MLRDRKKLVDSLRAYKAGEIPRMPGEGEDHFVKSIERRLDALNSELGLPSNSYETPKRKRRLLSEPPSSRDG
jgi:hypothetical protein